MIHRDADIQTYEVYDWRVIVEENSETNPAAQVNPRVERTKRHVLTAARDLLSERGPLDLTYTAISDRSGVTRQTLYRHWPTREALLADLVLTSPDVAYPTGSGDARTILTEFLTSLRAGMSDPPTAAALMTLAAQADRDDGSDGALVAIVADRRQALNALLGHTGHHIEHDDFARLCGPVIYQQLIARRTATDDLIAHTVGAWLKTGDTTVARSGEF
jgi:AcrR family transcriptional regulator